MTTPAIPHPRARYWQAVELLELVLHAQLPADRVMEGYFRAHRAMGPRDRGFAAETVYGCLRRRRSLEHVQQAGDAAFAATQHADAAPAVPGQPGHTAAEGMVGAYLLALGGWATADLERAGFMGDAAALQRAVIAFGAEELPFAVRADLPDELAEALLAQYGRPETERLVQALNQPATLDIRVNTEKATRTQLQERLRAEGFELVPTPLSPVGLRRADRAPLFRCASFQEGWFEVQDEGSQLIALLLQPRAHERLADFCAGAGGKTLHLGALLRNTGVVYAMDTSARRLQELKLRVRRSGLQNVRIVALQHERDRGLKRLAGKVDGVLVDVPCSGLGTLRRNPDLKWRPLDLDDLQARQARILAAAARLVRKGGRLVYATCSILRQENQDVVATFLAAHPMFARGDLTAALGGAGVQVSDAVTSEGDLCLLPHRHGTDGFFAALLQRAEPPVRAGEPSPLTADLDPRHDGC